MASSEPGLATLLASLQQAVVYDLAQPLQPGIPHHPFHPPFLYSMGRMHSDLVTGGGVSAASDFFALGGHTGTHIDALGHVSCNGILHGDLNADDFQDKTSGLKTLGIEQMAPIMRRGVLLDVAAYRGVVCLEPGEGIDAAALAATKEAQGVTIERGDAVLVRTGWSRYFNEPRRYVSFQEGTPGVTEDGARWLLDQGAALVGGDTIAFEQMPNPAMPVHRLMLVEAGVPIVEVLNLEELSAARCYEFLFVCIPLKITGATGSPARPLALRL